MTFARVLAVAHYGPPDLPAVRRRLIVAYAEVYEEEAAVDPFFSVPRFTDRLDRHTAHPKWSCAIGEIASETVGYAYGRPDSEAEWREMTTVEAPEVYGYGVGSRMFGPCKIMVRAPWRGAGVARTPSTTSSCGNARSRERRSWSNANTPRYGPHTSVGATGRWRPRGRSRTRRCTTPWCFPSTERGRAPAGVPVAA